VRLRRVCLLLTALLLASAGAAARERADAGAPAARRQSPAELRPTAHRAIPANVDDFWFAPPAGWRPEKAEEWAAARDLGTASDLIAKGKHAQALPLIRTAVLGGTPLSGYATYLDAVAQAGLDRRASAKTMLATLRATRPAGALADAITLRLADIAEADRDFATAIAAYESLLGGKPASPEDLQLRLMRAARTAGDLARARLAYKALRYDAPLSDAAATAEKEWPTGDADPLTAGGQRFPRELARAEKLYVARRFVQARAAFARLKPVAKGDTAELIALRIVECDVSMRRPRGTREILKTFFDATGLEAESRYFDLLAARDLGRAAEFQSLAQALFEKYPDTPWAEEALNALTTYLIIDNQDDRAIEVQRQLVSRYPTGKFTARAMWRTGWYAYRQGKFEDAAEIFEKAAAVFPRSDYRPSYLYWASKAREKAGDMAVAGERFTLTVVEYANSYYGRQSAAWLSSKGLPVPGGATAARSWPGVLAEPDVPPTVEVIRWLIAAGMHESALNEVQWVERTRGSTPMLQATRAYILNRMGLLRPAINLMRQVYPQFLAAGGETLPVEILKIIYPLDYWPLIREQSAANGLDPFLVAALICQESTFDKDIRSGANAYGLMQIVPATGRRYARKLGIRNFTTRRLTEADVNVRIGTRYFADLLAQFGTPHVALAGYNAGESRPIKWTAERPNLPQDEFIDDIPFAETQAYVRRILGSVDDYRRLYGGASATPGTR